MRLPNRKPKPTQLRIIQGNPSRRPLNKEEPQPKLGVPDCPPHLTPQAKVEWHRVSALLHECGLLAEVDRAALAAYCQSWARWVDAERMISESGTLIKSPTGFPMQHPALAVANKAMRNMYTLLQEFGMTPSARSRIKTGLPQEKDPFDELLSS